MNSSKIRVKPSDAASIIIIKRQKDNIFVLMGRRPLESKFMPGIYVFPGGSLEKDDFYINKYYKLKTNSSRLHDKTYSDNHSIAIQLAAIRETAEETGLFLGKKNDVENLEDFSEKNVWFNFYNKSLIPDIEKLIFLGRAITPSFMKIRFHARFFIAFIEDFEGKVTSNGELEELNWININDISLINIADVTEFMLEQIANLKIDFKKNIINYKHPMFTWRNKKRWIKWEK